MFGAGCSVARWGTIQASVCRLQVFDERFFRPSYSAFGHFLPAFQAHLRAFDYVGSGKKHVMVF